MNIDVKQVLETNSPVVGQGMDIVDAAREQGYDVAVLRIPEIGELYIEGLSEKGKEYVEAVFQEGLPVLNGRGVRLVEGIDILFLIAEVLGGLKFADFTDVGPMEWKVADTEGQP